MTPRRRSDGTESAIVNGVAGAFATAHGEPLDKVGR